MLNKRVYQLKPVVGAEEVSSFHRGTNAASLDTSVQAIKDAEGPRKRDYRHTEMGLDSFSSGKMLSLIRELF